jgi:hypothetical protein
MNPAPPTPAPERMVELGAGWPGWLPRLFVLLVGLAATAVLFGHDIDDIALVFVFVFALIVPAIPATPAPAILIGAIAVAVTAGSGDALRPEVLLEIPLLHLVHVGSSFAAVVPIRSIVQPAAVRKPLTRFLAVQVATFVVVGVAALLPTGRNPTVVELAGLIASTGLVVLAIRLVSRRH